jgi:molybdopterin/thiamine biosynthesis adenylyltransferase
VIGCGSVGAPVACALAQAGVGRLILVDPEPLAWPNVGRHPLGATAVGRNKAEALAERLQADFPHLKVEYRACGLHQLIAHNNDLLEVADMIVAATGNWVAESALNRWHVRQGRRRPIVYGWTEAHACAGHAVAIGQKGGCLQCHIGRTGAPELTVVEWPDGGDIAQEEPACGAHYQPYGPVELAYVNAMIAEVALDCLLDTPAQSFSRAFVASPRRIASLGGRLTEGWRSAFGEVEEGVRTVDRSWLSASCEACEPGRHDEAA